MRHDVSRTLRWPGRVGRSPCLLGVVRQAVRQSVDCVSDGHRAGPYVRSSVRRGAARRTGVPTARLLGSGLDAKPARLAPTRGPAQCWMRVRWTLLGGVPAGCAASLTTQRRAVGPTQSLLGAFVFCWAGSDSRSDSARLARPQAPCRLDGAAQALRRTGRRREIRLALSDLSCFCI